MPFAYDLLLLSRLGAAREQTASLLYQNDFSAACSRIAPINSYCFKYFQKYLNDSPAQYLTHKSNEKRYNLTENSALAYSKKLLSELTGTFLCKAMINYSSLYQVCTTSSLEMQLSAVNKAIDNKKYLILVGNRHI